MKELIMEEKTLYKIQVEVGEWSKKNFPNNTATSPLLGIFEEAGELAHAVLKLKQGIRGTREEHEAAEKDACADLLIYLLDYCDRRDINLQRTLERTWEQVSQRDWQKFPTDGLTK